ncbi:UDP-galactopyranose mutase [bacterium]|nr:UDP-galactopyranose mutase [bacterium]
MVKNLVVGAGFSGATIAYLIASKLNEKVLVIDKKDHIAGNCYDYHDKNNIMIHKYGSHIFHTSNEKVWEFLKQFTDFNQYMHKVIAVIDGIETTIPFNINTLYDVFPNSLAQRLETKLLKQFEFNKKVPILEFKKQDDEDLKFLADYVYEKVFLHYTTKQWGVSPTDVDGAVTARVPVYISKDNRYFQDKYQGIPLNGYTQVIKNMLNHPNIEVKLNTDYKDLTENYERVFYTGAIDEYYNFEFGELPYRSVNFKFEEYDREFYQQNTVVNYPCNYDFTRIHEYKHYLNDKSDKTVIAKEYSEFFEVGKNERYYPIPKDENIELYNKYLNKAKEEKNIYFLGRLGDYKYYDMDKAIARAIELFEEVKQNNG